MDKKNYIPVKYLIGYLIIIALFISVVWFLYAENKHFANTQKENVLESSTILKVSNLLTEINKTENLARVAIQSNKASNFKKYLDKSSALYITIDSLKRHLPSQNQIILLDSVKVLLTKKTKNIEKLKSIKNRTEGETAVTNAIVDLTKMEASLRKLEIKDFVKHPSQMGSYQRDVLNKYISYLNQNIPDDSSNTLTKKATDSILMVSKKLLNEVKIKTEQKKQLMSNEENALSKNELLISKQLQKVLTVIETEIIKNSTESYLDREKSLGKTNQIVTTAAIIGLLLALLFLIIILNDFSKSQLYKKQLEAANANTQKILSSREQLIATVSHDLKTPLSTIIGYTELLTNTPLNNKQQHFVENVKGSSNYIAQLVQDLLDFTQIEAGKIAVEKVSFSLPKIIGEVAESISSVYQSKSIELTLNISPELQQNIIGDPFRLRQIITNVIGNSFKFTEKGFIKIEASINSSLKTITILVEDSGIGIAEQSQQLIFEEFTQANEHIEKEYGGTGLGLTISKKIAHILGGDLSLSSELGKGTTIKIEMPLFFDEAVSMKNASLSTYLPTQVKVVVIDDDVNLLKLTAEVLKQNQFVPIPFTLATDALDWIANNSFDCILTDIQMPIMDGFSFVQELKKRANTNYKNQAVIAITGKNDLDLDGYRKRGFTTVIHKPYSPTTLIQIVEAIVNREEVAHAANVIEPKMPHETYTLDNIKAFLPNEKESLIEVIQSFMDSTADNLKTLEQAIILGNQAESKNSAHKMNPMFKQIRAHEISVILDQLELKDNSLAEITSLFETVKPKIMTLFELLKKEIN
ncbi:hybrid sensor histidine kinase/response regulator [Flavobacterium cellulosilyticum]|uniref:histidine kinase n=1 Tax=Flavobacterium cellulosilyticum TaxID=2541731 RepID=A0A4R5CHW3_9FLAO|nr:ATP-binding protein [Flavobacterium cellulosilyticum]TDD99345.1 response regulator [Flavobacterium cellulosilyticum]